MFYGRVCCSLNFLVLKKNDDSLRLTPFRGFEFSKCFENNLRDPPGKGVLKKFFAEITSFLTKFRDRFWV